MLDSRTVAHGDAKKVADLSALLEVSCQLGANTEIGPLLAAVQSAALRVMDCERVTIFLHDRQTDELYSRVATSEGMIRFPAARGIAGESLRTASVVNVPDAYADPRFNPEVDRRTGFLTRNILTCPLIGIDRTPVGVLQVLNKRGRAFDAWDEELIRTFGAQAGVAVQRQQLLDEYVANQRLKADLQIAHRIQQGLMPRHAPRIAGYDVAGWNRPADETGGDFFDFQELSNGALAVTLADVSGHGIGPALIAAECRALLRASLSLTQHLERVLALVNNLLSEDLPDDRFVTAFVGVLEPAEHRFWYISAGHGPLLHYRAANRDVVELPVSGLPLGILPGQEYDLSAPTHLGPGDVLAFVTDGVFEWPAPNNEQFGVKRVEGLLREHHTASAAEMIERTHQAVGTFSRGTPQQDDLTAVIIKRLG